MGSVPAALLALLIACAPSAASALTVEPFETAVEPVDSAEKNRAEELSTAEPIDLGGNTEDLGPQTFAPPHDDDLEYTDDEEEPGNGNGDASDTGNGFGETGNGEEGDTGNGFGDAGGIVSENGGEDPGDAGEIGNGYADGNGDAGETGNGYADGNGDAGETGNGYADGNGDAGETGNGYADGNGDAGETGYGEEPDPRGDEVPGDGVPGDENADGGSSAQWGGEVDDAAYDGSNDLKRAASDEVSAGGGDKSANGTKDAKVSSARAGNVTSARLIGVPSPKNETQRRSKTAQIAVNVRNSAPKSNGTQSRGTIGYGEKVRNETNGAPAGNRTRGKTRVSRGGPNFWNGYKPYVSVNRTRMNSNGNGSDTNDHGGNAGENSEVTARVVEIPQNDTRGLPELKKLKCWETTLGNCSEAQLSETPTRNNTYFSTDRYHFLRNDSRPNPGGLVQAESNKRSYNYDETQVPPPAGGVREIITYDYGDITEIIIPENSPAPIPSPASAALRYGLHPESSPYPHNNQPYQDHSINGYPRYTPEQYPRTTVVPHNSLPTYSNFHPPTTPPYPARTNFHNYDRSQNFNPSPSPPPDSNFNYAPHYNQNSSYGRNPYPSMQRANPPPQNPVSGHEFKSTANSQYNSKPNDYAPQYGGSSSPNYDGPTTPYHSSGPVYEFYGTPKSKTWIIYHRENGVVYEDDVFDDLTTPSPDSAPPLTSTAGYFPTSSDFPSYGNGRPPQRHGHPPNKFSGEAKSKKRPVNGNHRPQPVTPDAPQRNPRPRNKKVNANAPQRKPASTRAPVKNPGFDEDFPDDFPEEPKMRDQPKKKTRPPQRNQESRKQAKPTPNPGLENSKHKGLPDDRETGLPLKSKTKDVQNEDKDIFDDFSDKDLKEFEEAKKLIDPAPKKEKQAHGSKNSGFDPDDESFPEHPKSDFGGFPKIPKPPDFSDGNDDFPSRSKIPDFDSDEDFSDKDLKEIEEAEKLIDATPDKEKPANFEHERGRQKSKSGHSKNSEPSLRQRKEKAEKSNEGEKYDSGHKKSEGKKAEKGVKSDDKFAEAEKLHKSEAGETEAAVKKGGKKKDIKDEGGYYAEKHKGEKGEKVGDFSDEEKHAKGHSTKGKHEVHKKDEFSRKHSFFDEHHEGGKHEKEGGYEAAEEIEKGGAFREGHKSGGYKEGHGGKKGRFKEGKRYEEEKGEDEAEGNDEKSEHEEEFDKEEGKEQEEKKAFEL
ncbi:unnamed protein product [Bemisia tabaci]|uniref:Uncharacterized protein n=1 Tax=Bemisia tabaci TaxID=7038 RepID=A0A9P0ACI7_BEMTA|nr:unnamed protein product [Bemisia tabaci]